ncbi:MAG: nucleotidyltransferase family protein [Phycisphaerales bacterium]|nr:nucleotidyltransferase family protein [Phycisphaerales bacterium]
MGCEHTPSEFGDPVAADGGRGGKRSRATNQVASALNAAGVRYAVVGGNAVAAWVATVDAGAVRNTQDVDVLIDRAEFGRVRAALEAAGFVCRRAAGGACSWTPRIPARAAACSWCSRASWCGPASRRPTRGLTRRSTSARAA